MYLMSCKLEFGKVQKGKEKLGESRGGGGVTAKAKGGREDGGMVCPGDMAIFC